MIDHLSSQPTNTWDPEINQTWPVPSRSWQFYQGARNAHTFIMRWYIWSLKPCQRGACQSFPLMLPFEQNVPAWQQCSLSPLLPATHWSLLIPEKQLEAMATERSGGREPCAVSWIQCHSNVHFGCTGNWTNLAQASGASRTFARILMHLNQLF